MKILLVFLSFVGLSFAVSDCACTRTCTCAYACACACAWTELISIA